MPDSGRRRLLRRRLRALVEAAPLAILEFAADGELRQGNTAARGLLGHPAAGDALPIVFHPDTAAVLRQVVVDTAAGHPAADAEAVARRGDGTEVARGRRRGRPRFAP